MASCKYCGQEITFRYVDGKRTPIHLDGGWCTGQPRTLWSDQRSDGLCRKTNCPKCDGEVFFLRHNGGSVWLDELGWPWPKHECFTEPSPPWLTFFAKHKPKSEGALPFGLVVKADWLPRDARGPSRLVLAIDAGQDGRLCLAIPGANSADYLMGRLVSVDLPAGRLMTSNHDIKDILAVPVTPADIGLPSYWLDPDE